MCHALRFLLLLGLAGRAGAELPIAIPITDLPATNVPPGFVVPEPTRGARTNAAPVEAPPAPVKPPPVEPAINYGNRDWKVVPAPKIAVDSANLRNDDQIDGKLLGWDGTTVRWEHSAARQPLRLQCAGITSLKFAAPTNTVTAAPMRWLVWLTNGNLLTGDALTLDAEKVELTTPYAGRLRLPRAMVEMVRCDAAPAAARFRALQWLPGWDRVNFGRQEEHMNQQRWLYRDVGLPDSVAVELLVPVAQPMNLNLQFFTGTPAQIYNQPHYVVRLNGQYLTVASQGGQMGGGDNQPLQFRSARGRTVVDLAIMLNRNTGRVVVLVDGEVKRTVQLPPLPDGSGRGVLISGQQPSQELPPWLLVTPIAEEGQWASAKADTDVVQFANGDVLEGALEKIGPEKFMLNGKLGRVELPLERFAAGKLATARRTEPRRREGDVAVELHGGSRLTAMLQELTDTRLVLDSELFGKVAIAREIVSQIRWGLYDAAKKPPPPGYRPLKPWEPGTLELTGNRRLHGSLLGFADGAVRWQHPHAAEPMLFRQDSVVRATTTAPGLGLNPSLTLVKLTNCDRLSGELVSVDRQALQLRPAYMPPVSVPRPMVASVRPGAPPEGVLDTPGSPTWNNAGKSAGITVTNHHVNWTNRGAGEFFPRQGALPARTCLQFEVVDEGPSRNVTAFIYGRQSANGHVDAYYLNLAETQLLLTDPRAGGGNGQSVALPRPSASRSIAVTWLIDREQRAMWVLLEGQLAAQWQNRGTIQTGNLLSFLSQSSGPTQLRRVILSEWRGPVADLTNAIPPEADTMLAHDMTRVNGTLTMVRDGQVYFTGPTGTSIQGLGRVAQLGFSKAAREQPRRRDGDVRVFLPDGDQLTLSSARCDSNGLLGTGGAVGQVAIPANAILRVEFRPYDPPPKLPNQYYGNNVRQIQLDGCN
jgi:hypothetical protein